MIASSDSSGSIVVSIVCQACGVQFDASMWVYVDGGQDPDLLEQAIRGELRTAACPHGHTAPLDGIPLLIKDPASEPVAFFLPVRGDPPHAHVERFRHVVHEFAPKLGVGFDDVCLFDAEHPTRIRCRYACHQLPGTTRRFSSLMREAEAAAAASSSVDGLAQSVSAWESIVQHVAFDDTPVWFRRGVLSEAGAAWFRWSDAANGAGGLDRAIELLRQSVGMARRQPTAAGLTYNLGVALGRRYDFNQDDTDLDEAVVVCDQAAAKVGGDNPTIRFILGQAGQCHLLRFQVKGSMADLEAATALLRSSNSPGLPGRPTADLLMNFAIALNALHKFNPSTSLDEAMAVADLSVAVAKKEDRHRAKAIATRALIKETKYHAHGSISDLDAAIADLKAAAQLAPNDHELAPILGNLCGCLRAKFAHDGDGSVLEEGWRTGQQALSLTDSEQSRDFWVLLSNWAGCARDLFLRDHDLTWIDAAIGAFERALALDRATGLERARVLSNLGGCLAQRHQVSGRQADIDRAVSALKSALDHAPKGSETEADTLNNLAMVVVALPDDVVLDQELGDPAPLLERALSTFPLQSPDWLRVAVNIAGLAAEKPHQSADDESRISALFRRCIEPGAARLADVDQTLFTSWSHWALTQERWEEAAEAAARGLAAVEQLLMLQVDLEGRDRWLTSADGISAIAAYALARLGRLQAAMAAFEQFRVRSMSERLARRDVDLDRLEAAGRADLASRYRDISRKQSMRDQASRLMSVLNASRGDRAPVLTSALTSRSGRGAADKDSFSIAGAFEELRHEEQRQADACIAEIRRIPGFESFLARSESPVPFASESDAPEEQRTIAVIYFAVCHRGSLALVAANELVRPAWLAPNRHDIASWLVGEEAADDEVGYLSGQLAGVSIETALPSVLSHLGKAFIEPVVALLGDMHVVPSEQDRLLLIATGPLSMLPFHAAPFDSPGGRRVLLDACAVHFPISAGLWQTCGERLRRPARAAEVLVVSNPLPLPAEWAPLQSADVEADAICELLGPRAVSLQGNAATKEAVESALARCGHAHFAAHAEFDPAAPLNSGLILSGGLRFVPYSVDRGGLPLRLVVLSACQSAMIDILKKPDEVMGLATLFMEAGAAGVVGSLWQVDDLSTALLMVRFYATMVQRQDAGSLEFRQPCKALRDAQIWVRDLKRDDLERMASCPVITAEDRALQALAREFQASCSDWPGERPFADPFFWAGLVYYGR